MMSHIRPVSDLRTNLDDISKAVHETSDPVFLTKDGYGDMVLMSMEAFERKKLDNEIYLKLKEAELEAKYNDKRYSHEEVFSNLRARLNEKMYEENV